MDGKTIRATRLVGLGRVLKVFIWLAGSVSACVAVLRWFVCDVRAFLPPTLAAFMPSGSLDMARRSAGFCAELMPLAAAIYILVMLYRIASACIGGTPFGPKVGLVCSRLGCGLILLGAANGLYTALVSVILTYTPGAKNLRISFGLSTADLYLMVVGVAVMMLGYVMDEAYRIYQENSLII